MKKLVALILAVMMVLVLFSGCATKSADKGGESTAATTAKATETTAAPEAPKTVSIMVGSGPSWPFQEDWYILKKIKEKTGITLNVNAVTDPNFNDKVSITLASGDVPDLIYLDAPTAQKFGQQGALVNIFDIEKDMPNYLKWKNADKNNILPFLTSDGKLYNFSANEIGETNRMGWLYRKDVFDANKLQVPTNDEELYNVLKQLKQIYPDTYPLTFRGGVSRIPLIASSWGAGNNGLSALYGPTKPPYFYDASSDSWKYSPIEQGYKNLLTYLNKLYKEKLIAPDIISLDTKTWQDRMSGNQIFITMDYIVRIDYFNVPLRKINPVFTLAYMPPFKGGELGSAKKTNTASNYAGNTITAKAKNMQNAIQLMDWMFSDEGKETVSWGAEGETYTMVDGKRKMTDMADVTELRKKTGISTLGMYTRFDFGVHINLFSPELAAAANEDPKYDQEAVIPGVFTAAEQEIVATKGAAIQKLTDEMVAKFVVGQRNLSEWDKYVQEVKALGLDDMLGIYKASHERLKNVK
ncbi:MAG: extracellular solute-binding protein [Ruminiclostridium sp.]|nr:extracellular solute-binding protein [Ruminiclostridium sp.]